MSTNPSKAYANKEFLNSHEARSIRVLCELTEPDVRLQNEGVENTIVFFGSARSKPLAEAKNELRSYLNEIPSQNELDLDQKQNLWYLFVRYSIIHHLILPLQLNLILQSLQYES